MPVCGSVRPTPILSVSFLGSVRLLGALLPGFSAENRIGLKLRSPGLCLIIHVCIYPLNKYLAPMCTRPWTRPLRDKDDNRVSKVKKPLRYWHVQSITLPWDNASKAITEDYVSPGEAQESQPKGDGVGRGGSLEQQQSHISMYVPPKPCPVLHCKQHWTRQGRKAF